MTSTNQNIINPKPCSYNCGVRIFWDKSSNQFLEVLSKQRHVCKNKPSNNLSQNNTDRTLPFYNKKPCPVILNNLNQRCLIHLN